MPLTKPPRYHLPTHLDTPDTIDLPLFGVTVSVTMRQGILYLGGWSMAFNLWERSASLMGLLALLHWVVPMLLAFLTYVCAVQKVRGRYLEYWMLALYRYLTLPKVFVWCRVIEEGPLIPPVSESQAAQKTDDNDEEKEAA